MRTYSRCSGINGVSHSKSAMPMIAFIGVRISWLMRARKSLLARFASSAASLAFVDSAFGLLPLGGVLHRQQEQLAIDARLGELAGIEEHRAAADGGKIVGDFEIAELRVLRNDVFEQAAQFRNVPLAVAELVQQSAFRLRFRCPESAEERLVRHLHVQILVEDQQRLSHRLYDCFREGLDLLQDRFPTLIGNVACGCKHVPDLVLLQVAGSGSCGDAWRCP